MKIYQNLIPSTSALIAFERAAALGSFQAASEELNRTPSAISHAVLDIESKLGTKLFDREGRGIKLNAFGERYYHVVYETLDSLNNVSKQIANKEPDNALKISVSPFFASAVLIPNLSNFEDNFPEIELKIITTNSYINFENSDIDLTVRAGGNNNDLSTIKLVDAYAIVICSPNLIADKTKSLNKIKDLQHHSLISISNIKQAWPSWLKDVGAGTLKPKRYIEFDTTLGALDAVKNGLGVGLGIYPIIKGHSDYGDKIISPFKQHGQQAMTYNIVCRKEDANLEKIKKFSKWLSEKIDSL
tara:strand:+ start:26327 stop:27229 length:903 start_codon:yes stop_codon:yes gene_type:complete